MISTSVTTLYTALLALMFCALSLRVVLLRSRLKASFGDADDARLRRATRAHGNFAEYVPLALMLLLMLELAGRHSMWLHAAGSLLLVSRAAHAFGLSQVREWLGWRIAGVAGTFTVISGAAVALLLGLPGPH